MQIFSVFLVWNTRIFSIDYLRCLLFAFVGFYHGSVQEGEAKAQEDCYLALAGGSN